MGVGAEYEWNASFSCPACVLVVEVHSVGLSVDFQCGSGLGADFYDLFHIEWVGFACTEQSACGVSNSVDVGVEASLDDSVGVVALEVGVDGGDDEVQFFEEFVGQVQLSVGEDVHFCPGFDEVSTQFGVDFLDFFFLLSELFWGESAGDAYGLGVVG